MEDRLKHLMQELGNAINESLSDSERIAESIGEIKRSGYDVFLVLEATIGFNKRDESGPEDGNGLSSGEAISSGGAVTPAARQRKRTVSTGKIKLTSQDQKFLKALKIAVDEEKV